MLANPYVAVTVLVVGLVAATWALYDATTTQEKAQNDLMKLTKNLKDTRKNLQAKQSNISVL